MLALDGAYTVDDGTMTLHPLPEPPTEAMVAQVVGSSRGADSGGDRAAVIYTMLRCCQLANVDPVEYVRDVLSTLFHKLRRIDVPELMPARWNLRAQPA